MLDVFEQSLNNTGKIIAGVKTSQFGDATPCKKFTVKDLLNHIIGDCYFFSMVGAGQQIDLAQPTPDLVGDDPVSSFEQGKKIALDAFRGADAITKTWNFPFGSMPGAQAIGLAISEAVVHGWDLAKATGQPHGIDQNLAGILLEGAKHGISPGNRNPEGNPFGPEVNVPDGADNVAKLVAFFGRQP